MRQILGHRWTMKVAQLLSAIVGFILLGIGIAVLIMPEVIASLFLSLSTGGAGINSLRADIGALFLGLGVLVIFGALSRHRWVLIIPAIFLGFVVIGRVISMIIDPFPTSTVRALTMEISFIIILVMAILSRAVSEEGGELLQVLRIVFSRRVLIASGLVFILIAGGFLLRPKISSLVWSAGVGGRLTTSAVEDLPDGLHVGLAGTGAPMPDSQRVGISTFVIAGEHQFIIDCGPGSTLNLELMRYPLEETTAVLLTHFHSDHIGDLGELMLKIWTNGVRTEPVPVMGPIGVKAVVEGFNQAYSLDAEYRYAHHGDAIAPRSGAGGRPVVIDRFGADEQAVIFDDDGVRVTAFLVSHAPVEPALGYRIDYGGRSVVLSGDTIPDETLMELSEGVDILIHDAMNAEMLDVMTLASNSSGETVAGTVAIDIQDYHAFTEETARIARDADVGELVLNQILPPIPASILHPAFLGDSGNIYQGSITVSYDGMLFSLPADSDDVEKYWLLK